jgi:uncharacterized protein YecT (DUF1311 family)
MIIEGDHHSDSSSLAAHKMSQRLLLADVRRDLATIFGDARASSTRRADRAQPVLKIDPARISTTRRRVAAGPMICAALAGLLLGMAVTSAPGLIDHWAAPSKAMAPAMPALTVVESPFEGGKMTTPPVPIHKIAAEPTTASAALRAASEPGPVPAPTAARIQPPAVAQISDENAHPAPARRSEQEQASAGSASWESRCAGDRLERHWCMREDILEADRALRRAYAKAINEGVERRFLVAHQRRWTRLRDRATRDPDAVLEGYRELADDLERLAINGRQRDRI